MIWYDMIWYFKNLLYRPYRGKTIEVVNEKSWYLTVWRLTISLNLTCLSSCFAVSWLVSGIVGYAASAECMWSPNCSTGGWSCSSSSIRWPSQQSTTNRLRDSQTGKVRALHSLHVKDSLNSRVSMLWLLNNNNNNNCLFFISHSAFLLLAPTINRQCQ